MDRVSMDALNMKHRAAIAALIALSGSASLVSAQDAAGLTTLARQPALGPTGAPVPEQQPADGDAEREDNVPGPLANENSRVAVNGEADQLVVDLHVNDEELANVLEMLSIQSQRNIVASKNVSATVTANLYGVTFFEALDAILHVNGFGYLERGNFIYVYTLEELAEIEKQNRQRVSAVVKLNYLSAVDASEFVKPLLSEGGQIKANAKTANFQIPENAPVGADEYANDATLVIYDYEENVEEVKRLIAAIDTRPAQVLVEATILQTALNENNAFGVDFALIGDLNFNDFVEPSGPLGVVDGLISGQSGRLTTGSATAVPAPRDGDGQAVVSSPGNTSGPATMKVGVVAGNDLAIFLRMLDEVTDTTILSNPKILALNRQPARVLVGRKVGYLNTTATDTSTTQTVEFLDTGTQLYFRPFVTNEGLIRMELKPQVSEAVIRDARDATGAAVTIPDEITNELVTNVMVRDGQTIVLGGLFRESTTSTRRQVPVLGDIPLIGTAFRGHDDEVERSEIIFMITPSIVNDNVLLAAGQKGMDAVESARAGAREGLLPFSREKMTGELLVEAERLAAEGNTEKALWKTRQALSLNPRMPEAIQLRERLTGKSADVPSRSLLGDIFRRESGAAAPAPSGGPVREVSPGASAAPTSADVFGGAPTAPVNTTAQSFTGWESVQRVARANASRPSVVRLSSEQAAARRAERPARNIVVGAAAQNASASQPTAPSASATPGPSAIDQVFDLFGGNTAPAGPGPTAGATPTDE